MDHARSEAAASPPPCAPGLIQRSNLPGDYNGTSDCDPVRPWHRPARTGEGFLREPRLILGIGELLWDLLPEGPRLGGAPANFTVMAGRLGNHAAILSRIGRDDLGRAAMEL